MNRCRKACDIIKFGHKHTYKFWMERGFICQQLKAWRLRETSKLILTDLIEICAS